MLKIESKYYRLSLFFLCLSVLFFGCNSSSSMENKSIEKKQNISNNEVSKDVDKNSNIKEGSSIENFSLEEYTESGEKKWQVQAATANIYENIVNLTTVVGIAYGKEIDVTIKSDRGVYDKKTRNFQLLDNVKATTTDGMIMKTEKLNWQADKEEAFTDHQVLVKNDTMKILGEGAQVKPNLKEVQFKKNVVTNIEPDTIIVCDGSLQVNYNDNHAVFKDNVIVKDDKGKIWADKMTVYFNKTRKIEKVIAEGNVKIKRGQNITSSKKAEYLAKENKIVLTGKPKLFVYPEDESGEEKKKTEKK